MFRPLWLWRRWLLPFAKGLLLSLACTPHLPELDEIEALQRKVRTLLSTQGAQNSYFMSTALELVRAQEAFIKKYPNHPIVPKLLIESAEIYATYFGDAQKAVELLRQVDVRFRHKSTLAPKALFYEAFLYETVLGDTAIARRRYEDFLQFYPDHDLAKDARLSLENLGKPPDQLIREIMSGISPPTP